MKKLIAGAALLAFGAFASAQSISFNETTHDFGTVSPKSDGNASFTVKNTGDKPLIISRVQPSCGCTTPQDWTKDPILPGKTGKIYLHYDVATHPGAFNKMVEVYSNDPENSRSVIYIKGNVDANAPASKVKDAAVSVKDGAVTVGKKVAKGAKKIARGAKEAAASAVEAVKN